MPAAIDTPASGARPEIYLLLGASIALLLGAYAFQYLGGLPPCKLCIFQRVPHAAAIVFSLVAVLRPASCREIFFLLAISYAISTGLGIYHAGIEWQWWQGPASCSAAEGWDGAKATVEELMAHLSAAPVIRCDVAPWSLFGLSLAGYNALFSLGLLGLSAYGFTRVLHRNSYTYGVP